MLFTQDSGMLFASAKSVREERSKQRYALQDFSRVRVTLVKGKSGWKVGSVEAFGNAFMSARSRSERALIHTLFLHIRRYVHGEVALTTIYADLRAILENFPLYTDHERLGELFLLRLLTHLGYTAVHDSWKTLVETDKIREALLSFESTLVPTVRKVLSEAQNASQL